MRKLIFTLMAFVSLSGFGQKMIENEIDNIVTFNIPENFEVFDTLGQSFIKSTFDYGFIIISKTPFDKQQRVNIRDENELNEFYKGIKDGVIESSKGELIEEKYIEINKLKLIKFSYRAKMGEEFQIRDCLGLFVNNSIYSFNYWRLESKADEMETEKEAFFSSIRINPELSLENQLTNSTKKSTSYDLGYLIGKIFGFILIFGTIALIIILITKRRKKKNTNA